MLLLRDHGEWLSAHLLREMLCPEGVLDAVPPPNAEEPRLMSLKSGTCTYPPFSGELGKSSQNAIIVPQKSSCGDKPSLSMEI